MSYLLFAAFYGFLIFMRSKIFDKDEPTEVNSSMLSMQARGNGLRDEFELQALCQPFEMISDLATDETALWAHTDTRIMSIHHTDGSDCSTRHSPRATSAVAMIIPRLQTSISKPDHKSRLVLILSDLRNSKL